MKEGWIVKKLGDICEIKSGKSISATCIKETKSSSMFECYGGNGIRGYVETYRFDGVFPIIGRVGALCGNVHLACGKFNATEHALVVNIKSKDINPYWLVYNLKSMNLRNIAKGVAQPVISAGEVVKINIFVPDFEEQTQIVEELDQLSNIIEKQRQQLSELDNLAQSIFYDMFGDPVTNEKGWEVGKLKDVAPQRLYQGEVPSYNDKYWLLNLDKIEPNTGEIAEKCYFSKEDIGNSTFTFDSTHVLYSKLRPYLNKVVVPDGVGYATTELVPLCPKHDVLERLFLAYLLRSRSFVTYINSKVVGAKMPRVSMEILRMFPVILPPLSLQQLFAQKIEAIEQEKEIIKQSIAETEELFNSRMDYYFG